MAQITIKKFEAPDEKRPFEAHGQVDILKLEGFTAGKGTFEPGWRWSRDVKPIAGTPSCQSEHCGYVIAGRMKIAMDDGTEGEVGPGDVMFIPPGHDAWVVGDEPCVALDFNGMEHYAERAAETSAARPEPESTPAVH